MHKSQLVIIYSNSQYIEPDFEKKTHIWQSKLDENNKDFIKEIYGR